MSRMYTGGGMESMHATPHASSKRKEELARTPHTLPPPSLLHSPSAATNRPPPLRSLSAMPASRVEARMPEPSPAAGPNPSPSPSTAYASAMGPCVSVFDNKLFRADRSSSRRHHGGSNTSTAMKSLAAQPANQDPSQSPEALSFQVEQLTSQLVAEVEARQAVEEEAWVLERQLLTWQEATQSAKLQVQSLQAQRDKIMRENQILQESLAEAAHEKQQLEAQLRKALNDVGSMSVDSAEHEGDKGNGGVAGRKLGGSRLKPAGPHSGSRQSPCYTESDVESLDRLTSLNAENDDLAQRLLEKQLELAKMKEQQEEEQRARYILESVNLQLAKKVERLTELIADMRTGMA